MTHVASVIELPKLIAVGAVPLSCVGMSVLIREANGDAVSVETPQVFDEFIIEFLGPF